MRVFETLFHVTILLTFVFGTSIRRSSESFRENVETEQAAQSNANVQPRGGRKSLLPLFEQIIKSFEIVEENKYIKVANENEIVQNLVNFNNEKEDGFNEEFISNFYSELIKAKNIYREALIKQEKYEKNKKSFKNLKNLLFTTKNLSELQGK
uniref:Uncharacterized protein n=1 Tax=Meloidogyne enterolobii TaxID=390850 RepID=A0A6V7TWQ2_MELEN|nr:unnamed protein product [Meloidogyne enterolobii]